MASSASVERTFSIAGKVLLSDRCQLDTYRDTYRVSEQCKELSRYVSYHISSNDAQNLYIARHYRFKKKKLSEQFVFGGRAPTFWRASKFLGGPVSFQIYWPPGPLHPQA